MGGAGPRRALPVLVAAALAACTPAGGGGGVVEVTLAPPDAAFPTADADAGALDTDPADTGPADTGGAEADAAPPSDTAGGADADAAGACAPGQPCDDGDPCTFNDQCVAGACQGAAVDCDDGVPCTADACVGGACQHPIADGFCLVDGACWSNGQPNPKDPCQRCAAPLATKAWSPNDGQPCDDGDPCTAADACAAGACAGKPVACEDDGDPCTQATCVGGTCEHKPAAGGPCDDGDPCTWPDVCDDKGQCTSTPAKCPDDGDPCTAAVCAGGACGQAPLDGGPCDGACATGGTCAGGQCVGGTPNAEVCDDGVDNDCNGQTDAADAACGVLGKACSWHTDCYPEAVCAAWATTGAAVCSAPCAGDADCGAGQVCSKLPGSAQVGFCEAAPAGLAANGQGCADDVACTSGLCVDGVCEGFCLSEAQCAAPGHTCHPVGDLAAGFVSSACSPDAAGLKLQGQPCTDPANPGVSGGYVCASGHCDLLAPVASAQACASVCRSKADCPPNQECNVILYGLQPNPASIYFDPQFPQATYDAQMGCYTPPSGPGALADKAVCTQNGQCQSALCLPLLPGSATRYCTRHCTTDAQCQQGMKCKLDVTNLASTWLQNAALVGGQPANTNAWSLVRLCKLP